MAAKRVPFTTTYDSELLKQLKILSIKLERRTNDLLEEAVRDLLRKYDKSGKL